jgi:hypothetical protein
MDFYYYYRLTSGGIGPDVSQTEFQFLYREDNICVDLYTAADTRWHRHRPEVSKCDLIAESIVHG